MDQATRNEIRELVLSIIAENALEFRKSTSSVEIGKSSAGKPSFNVKVYGNNSTENANRARIIERRLSAEYFGAPLEEPEPYPEPTDEEIGAAMGLSLKAPADYQKPPAVAVSASAESEPIDADYKDVPVPDEFD